MYPVNNRTPMNLFTKNKNRGKLAKQAFIDIMEHLKKQHEGQTLACALGDCTDLPLDRRLEIANLYWSL
jgi:hypothetical protein